MKLILLLKLVILCVMKLLYDKIEFCVFFVVFDFKYNVFLMNRNHCVGINLYVMKIYNLLYKMFRISEKPNKNIVWQASNITGLPISIYSFIMKLFAF